MFALFLNLFLLFAVCIYGAKITNSTTGSVTTYIITQTNTVDPVYVIAFVNSTVVVLIETAKTQSSSFSLIGRSSSVIPITISPLGYKPTGNYLLDCVEENNGDIFQCIKDDVVVVTQNTRIAKPFAEITSLDLINSQGVMVRGGFGEDCSMPTVTWINVEFPGLNITVMSNQTTTCLDNFGVSFGGMYKTFYQDPLTTRLMNETRVFRKEETTRYQRFVIQRFDDDVNLRLVFSTADGTSIKPFNERILSLLTFPNSDLFGMLPLNVSFAGGCVVQIAIHDTLAATTQDIWEMLDLEEINDLNWYRNALPTRFYTTQVCNFHVGRLDKNNLLVYPFTVEGEMGGGRPSFRTGGLFGSPIQIDKNIHFEDYDLDCGVFWPIGKEFNGYGLTGSDGSLYAPYTPSNQLCYSPFLYVNEIKNQELLLSNGKELDCSLQGGFTVGVTKDACAKLMQTTRCKKGHLYYAGFCYYKFDVETETRFFVVQAEADNACKQLNPLLQAAVGINNYLKSFLQKKFVFWKRQQPGFPYRLTIKSQSCLAFDYQHNGDNPDDDTESVYEISCEEPAFPLCRYPTHEVPIPHAAVLMDARTVNILKNGQEGVPREGLQMECQCASGWCSDTCETACCSISQVLLLNDSLTPFLTKCSQGNRGACYNGNPRYCQCYEGFGPSVSWLEDPNAKILCSCPTTNDNRLYFATDYIVNDVRYNITARSNSICGGSSRGKCTVEETINEGFCVCNGRTDMNPDTPAELKQRPGYDGRSCTLPLPIVPSDGYNVNGDLTSRYCNCHGTGCPNGERCADQQLNEVFGVLYGRKECREINGDTKYGCSCDDGYGGQACTCPLSINLLNAKIYKLPDEQEGIFSYLKRKEIIRSVVIDGPCDDILAVTLILTDSTSVECDIDDPIKKKYQCDPAGKQASQVNVYFTKLKKDNLRCIIRGFNEDLDLCGSNPNPYAARFYSNEVKRGDDFFHDPQRSDEGPYGCTITECMYSPQATGKYGRTGISGYRQSPVSDELAMEVCGMSTLPARGSLDSDGLCKCNTIDGPFTARFTGVACEAEESLIDGKWKQCHGRGISKRPKFPYGDCSFDLLDRNADPLNRPGIVTTQSTFNQSFVFTVTSNFSIIYMRDGFWKFEKGQKLVISKLRQLGSLVQVDYPNQKLPSNITYFCDNEFTVKKVKGLSTLLKFDVGLSVVEEPDQEYDMVTPKCTSTSFVGHSSLTFRCVNKTEWVDMGEYDNEETLESDVYEGSVLIVGEFSGESSTDIQLSYGVFGCEDAVDRILNDVALRLGYVTTKQCLNASIVAYSSVNGAGYGLWRDYITTIPGFEEELWSDDNYLMLSNLLGGVVALDSNGRIDELAFNERIWENMTLTWLDSAGLELTITANLTSVPINKTLVGFNLDWNYQGLFGTPYAHEDFYMRNNFSKWTWNYRPVYSLDVPIETEYLSGFSVRIPSGTIDCLQVYTSKGKLCGTWYSLVANSTLTVNCDGLFVTDEDSTSVIIDRFTAALNNTNASDLLEAQYLASNPLVNIRMAWSSSVDVNFTKSDFVVFGRDKPYSSLFSELKRQLKEELKFPNNTVYANRASLFRSIDLQAYDDRDYLKRMWYTHLAPRKCTNNWQCKTFARKTETYSCVFDAEYVKDWTAHGSLKAAEIGDEGGCQCNSTLFDPTFFCSRCVHGYGPNDQESLWNYNRFTNSSETELCAFPWLEESTKKNKVCGGRGTISQYEATYQQTIHVFKNNVTRRCEAIEDPEGNIHELNMTADYDVDVMWYGSDWFIASNRIFLNNEEKIVESLVGENTIVFTDETYLVCIPIGYSPVYRTTIYYRYDDGTRRRVLTGVTDQNIVVEFIPSRYSFWKNQLTTRITDRVGDAPVPPPTKAPTSYPSTSPTNSPSKSPITAVPSKSPTTSVPSKSPTTTKPSLSPSKSPSTSPKTTSPSKGPSGAPSTSPNTSKPSSSPSFNPSNSPVTSNPSGSPTTSKPSNSPSKSPSSSPKTTSPSKSPSNAPSNSPKTTSPSISPTLSPTTLAPTKTPTKTPTTAAPTKAPTNNLGTCTPTGTMITARGYLPPVSNLLPNGRVLIAGGNSASASVLCELYNIGTGTWASTGSMSVARHGTTQNQYTISLPNGNVLVIPGSDLSDVIEVYDWLSGTWSLGPVLPSTYHSQQPVVLTNGQVLITAGIILGGAETAHCFLYDPTSNTLIQTGSLPLAVYSHTAVALQNGNAIVIGGARAGTTLSTTYLYTTSTGVWSTVGALPATAHLTQSILLNDGNVLTCGGYRNSGAVTLSSCFLYNAGTWTTVGSMGNARNVFNMILLPNGEVQAIGGYTGSAGSATTGIYTPSLQTWRVGASISSGKWHHSSVYLGNSNFLVFGGYNGGWTQSADLCTIPFTQAPVGPPVLPTSIPTFAPTAAPAAALTCTPTGNMIASRANIRSLGVTLTDGRVLVCGGSGLTSCETFNPDTGTWTVRGSMSVVREGAWSNALRLNDGRVAYFPSDIATTNVDIFDPNTNLVAAFLPIVASISATFGVLLNDGRVLLIGGHVGGTSQTTCQMLDFALNTARLTGSLLTAFYAGYAVRLQNGNVLTIGGYNGASIANCQLFNVVTETWSAAASLPVATHGANAYVMPNGNVFVYGGATIGVVTTCYVYNVAGNFWSTAAPVSVANYVFNSIVFPNGEVMRLGGNTADTTTQIYNPASGQGVWRSGPTVTSRSIPGAALLLDGRVLYFGAGTAQICTSPVTITNTPTSVVATIAPTLAPTSVGSCSSTGSMVVARHAIHTRGRLLNDGRVLICGGQNTAGTAHSTCELFNPTTNTFSATVSLSVARTGAWSYDILLADGRVAFFSAASSTVVEIFDPVSNTISTGVPLLITNPDTFPVLLTDGTVLLIGGSTAVANCYIYNVSANTVSVTGSLVAGHFAGFAVRLQNGNVLTIGGYNGGNIANCQLYNFVLGTWSSVANYPVANHGVNARLLNSGNVLSCGGGGYSSTCYVYNPTFNLWANAAPMSVGAYLFRMVDYPNGDIIRVGGETSGSVTNTVQFYSQATGKWRSGPNLVTARSYASAVALQDGRLLVFGGWSGSAALGTAELCTPPITSAPTPTP